MPNDLQAPSAAPTSGVRVKIHGGLGNQMLQYAAARSLALSLNEPLSLDLTFYANPRHRRFELDRFPIDAHWRRPSRRVYYADRMRRMLGRPHFRGARYAQQGDEFDPRFPTLTAPVELYGYFFSEKYFARHASQIRQELAPPVATDDISQRLAEEIQQSEAAALHIRRGDYVTSKKAAAMFASCGIDYYTQAMQRLPKSCRVFVFSDDIAWAKDNLPAERSLTFVDATPGQDGLRDMWLMTLARHHIIANSSFSWWGAWLADPELGIKIAPAKWYNDPSINDQDIIPSTWDRL